MSELMISVAGIRGVVGDSLTPDVITRYAAAFGTWLGGGLVMLGTDSRPSREMVTQAAVAGLTAVGIHVRFLGIAPTPTIQLWAEKSEQAVGGIALTASHNPLEWNALKLFDHQGALLDDHQGAEVQDIFQRGAFSWTSWEGLGRYEQIADPLRQHIDSVLKCSLIKPQQIRNRQFAVAVDAVGGAAGSLIVRLLKEMGCRVFPLGCDPTGQFHRNPEPLPDALDALSELVRNRKADIGFALDPDGDRLAVVDDTGQPVGEEYTVAAAVDFVLAKRPGPVVVNLSTTQAVDDIAKHYGVPVTRGMVGESHVAKEMRRVGAVIGGEGNGGVMFPEVHTARDAAVGIALILQYLAESGKTSSKLFSRLPHYVMIKEKMPLGKTDAQEILNEIKQEWQGPDLDTRDGVKRHFPNGWVQVRASNTEPILRIFAEAKSREQALQYIKDTKAAIESKS
jgi:phosphomannomutase